MTDHGSNTPDTPSEKSSTEHDREIQATIERILAADRERERLAGRGGSSADTTGSADSVVAEGVEVGAEGSETADAVDPEAQASGRGQRGSFLRFGQAEALDVGQTEHSRFDGLQQDLEERRATRRVQGLDRA